MKDWFNRLYARSLKWGDTKWSTWTLFFCAFADASFLPLPTPMLFLTLMLLHINKAYKYAFYVTAGTLVGAMAGYSIGYFAWLNVQGEFTRLAQFLFDNIPGFTETTYNNIQIQYAKWDFGVLFLASLMPVPYKIFSISSGVFDLNIIMFLTATLISQGAKYYLLAYLTLKYGHKVKEFLLFRLKKIALISTACIVIIVVAIKIF